MKRYSFKQKDCTYLGVYRSQYVGQVLEQLICINGVKADEIVTLAERRLVQLLNNELDCLTHGGWLILIHYSLHSIKTEETLKRLIKQKSHH